jgi:hypothetical protein
MHGSPRFRRPGTVLAATVLTATLLALPATAGAATGTTSIALSGPAASSLKANKVKLVAGTPAKATAKRISLTVAGGSLSSSSASVSHGGSLRLKAGKRSAQLSDFKVVLRKKPRVTARLGKSTVTFATLKLAKSKGAKIDVAAKTVSLTGATATVPAKTAKALARSLKLRKLSAGRLGSLKITANLTAPAKPAAPAPAPAAPAAPAPTPGPPVNVVVPPVVEPPAPPVATQCPSPLPAREAVVGALGDATWTMRSTWITYLKSGKGCVVGTNGAEATATDQNHSAFAVVRTTVASDDTTTIYTKGTVTFLHPGHFVDIRISDPTFTIKADGTGYVVADGQGSGDRADAMAGKLAAEPFTRLRVLDIASSSSATVDGTRTWSDVVVNVAAGDAARHLAYEAGQPYGSFSLSAVATVPAPVWHLKESWINYITGSGGTVTADDGASQVSPTSKYDYAFTDGVAETAADGTVTVEHRGRVRMQQPVHSINNVLANPVVVVAPGGASAKLYADGEYGSMANPGQQTPFTRLHLLDLNLTGIVPTVSTDGRSKRYADVPTKVAADGATALSYPAGEEYGKLSFSVPVN